jgi:DNA-binding MarR family transcriptional regulator
MAEPMAEPMADTGANTLGVPQADSGAGTAAPPREVPRDPAPADAADHETRVTGDDHESLRLWLRLLTCTMMIERRVRARLRERFAITLPRFDLLAQLERHPQGLRMGELTRRLMVTGGNVTGLVNELVAEGLVRRLPIEGDRRAQAVRLTPRGKKVFDAMALDHERWLVDMLAGLSVTDRRRLFALLGTLKTQLAALPEQASAP